MGLGSKYIMAALNGALAMAALHGAPASLATRPVLEHPAAPLVFNGKNLIDCLAPSFLPEHWHQRENSNCVAYGALVACSVSASIAFGRPIVLDPDSTLASATTVPKYIEGLNDRNYFDLWVPPQHPYIAFEHKFAFSGIAIQQMPSGPGARQAIREAIDGNRPVVFAYNYPKGGAKGSFHDFWYGAGKYRKVNEDSIFYDIAAPGDEVSKEGHTMCIIGYDDGDGSFIVQNSWGATGGRANGTFKMPQGLDYGAWHFHDKQFPEAGGEHRYLFFALAPNWVMDDTAPPSIELLSAEISDDPEPTAPYRGQCKILLRITDDVKVSKDVFVRAAAPGLDRVDFLEKGADGRYSCTVPVSDAGPTKVTITAYDTSGNKAEHKFQCVY